MNFDHVFIFIVISEHLLILNFLYLGAIENESCPSVFSKDFNK